MENQSKNKIYSLLRWSEKYTKTDMSYIARNGSWLIAGQFISVIVGFALSVAFANLLPLTTYGTYQFVLALASLISSFTLTGMGTAIVQSTAKGYEGSLKVGTITHLKWNLIPASIGILISIYYFLQGNLTLSLALIIAAIFSPLIMSANLYSSYLGGKKLFRISFVYNAFRVVVPALVLLSALYFFDNISIIVLLVAYFASHSFISVIIYLHAYAKLKPDTEKTDDGLITYGKHLSLMRVLNRVSLYVDKILLFHFFGAAQLAIYTFAIALPRQLQSMSSRILGTLALPKLSESSMDNIKHTIFRKALIIFLFSIAIVFLYVLAAPFIYNTFFPKYTESILYSQILSLLILFTPSALLEEALVAHKRKRDLYIIRTIRPVVRILFLAILLPMYGLLGAAMALISTQSINIILLLKTMRKV